MAPVSSTREQQVGDALAAIMRPHRTRVKTITADNGHEFAQREDFAKLMASVYFARPYHSHERCISRLDPRPHSSDCRLGTTDFPRTHWARLTTVVSPNASTMNDPRFRIALCVLSRSRNYLLLLIGGRTP
jgi:hypothetical protein